MRFRISLHPEKAKFKLPYNYNYPLAAAIHSFLYQGDALFTDFLHDEGFYHGGKAALESHHGGIESGLTAERLKRERFHNAREPQDIVEAWRWEYNNYRPRSFLTDPTLEESVWRRCEKNQANGDRQPRGKAETPSL